MSLQGNIEEMGLGEIIQALSLNRHRGTLRIETEEGTSKFFALSEGEIVLIRTVRSEPVKIGELLQRAGKVSREKLGEALELQRSTGQRLGETLVALGACTHRDVDQVVRDKFEQEFLDIFLLDRGRFEFIFGLTPEKLFSPEEKLERIALDTQGLMLEAMRRVDDYQALLTDLGSLDAIYVHKTPASEQGIESYTFPGLPLPPELKRDVFDALDGRKTIRDVLGFALEHGASRAAAFGFLHSLHKEGLIRPLDVPECLARAKTSLEAQDAPATARFLRSVLAKGQVDREMVAQYVEFLRRSSKPSFARAECKHLAAGYLAHGETDHAIALYGEALEIEPNDTEVLDRLFYTYLRKTDVARALDTGVRFREFLSRDGDVPVVARVLKNMQELAPEDWRVVELSGLLLKRQERPAEARRELERALSIAKTQSVPEDQLVHLLDALIELDPERAALAKERERLVRQSIVAEAQAIARRRLQKLFAVVLLIAVVLAGWEELAARHELRAAEDEWDNATEPSGRIRALELFRSAAERLSTKHWQAEEEAQKAEVAIHSDIAYLTRSANEAILERKHREEDARRVRDAADHEKAVGAALAEIQAARDLLDFERATRLANELYARWKDLDPRAAAVTVPIRVRSTPPGFARVGEGRELATPCLLEAPPGRTVSVNVRKPGYLTLTSTVDTTSPGELDLRLERGPAWRVALGAPLLGVVAGNGPKGEVAVARAQDGTVTALAGEDGHRLWSVAPSALEAAPAGTDAPGDLDRSAGASLVLAGVAAGRVVVPGRSGDLIFLDLVTGAITGRLGGSPVTAAPLTVDLVAGEHAVVVRGTSLEVVEPVARQVVRTVALPAGLAAVPVVASRHTLALALTNGKLVLVDAERGLVLWSAAVEGDLAGPPAVSSELRLVFVATRDSHVAAYSLESGALAYRGKTEPPSLSAGPAVLGHVLCVAAPEGVAALDGNDGRALWAQALGATSGAPVWLANRILVPLATGEIVELGAQDGARRGAQALDGPPAGAPFLKGNRVYFAGGTTVLALEKLEEE